jgi:hypothetical protein
LSRDGLSRVTTFPWARTALTETGGIGPASPTVANGATRASGWAIIRGCQSNRSAFSSPMEAPVPPTGW